MSKEKKEAEMSQKRKKVKYANTFFSQFVKLLCLVLVVIIAVVILKRSGDTPAVNTATDTSPVSTSTGSTSTGSTTTTASITETSVTPSSASKETTVSTATTKTTVSATTTTEATTTREPGYITKIPTDSEMSTLITDKLLDINPYSRPANKYLDPGVKREKITTIVIHYVANPGTSAISNRNYFNNLPKNEKIYAGAHYIVGLSGEIIRCIPDNEIAYHAGKAEVNACSIGIEVCHPDKTGKFNYQTYLSLLKLVSWLCDKYDITYDNVIRHYDVTGKACPVYYINYPSEWKKFKDRLIFN